MEPIQTQVDGFVRRLELCRSDICAWMGRNFLKINDAKTEVLLIGSSSQLKKISILGVKVRRALITPSAIVRDLVVILDTNMTLVPHVSVVGWSAGYHIRNAGKIRRLPDMDSCETLVHAFMTSQLDLNNCLLMGLAGDAISKLQLIQTMAARVFSRTRINEHVTAVLMGLHWLPPKQRIQCMILSLAYKAQHELSPG